MRSIPSSVLAHVAAGGALLTYVLIWIVARDRATNAPAPVGLWTGADVQLISGGGDTRTYYGAGSVLSVDPITSTTQAKVKRWSFRVSPLSDDVISAVRLYNARLASVEVHEWFWDAAANAPLADPVRALRGTVQDIQMPVAAMGTDAVATITCATDAWRLTKGLTMKRSASALESRAPGDGFRRYNAITGSPVVWGEKLEKSETASTHKGGLGGALSPGDGMRAGGLS